MSKLRCSWANGDPLLEVYHDREWGTPLFNDQKHFEYITLEVFQCGLSWLTVLRKRDALRRAFDDFDPSIVASYTKEDVERIMACDGVIKSRVKIEATIKNASAFIKIAKEYGSYSSYIWSFTNGEIKRYDIFQTKNELSEVISKDLKKRGFSFLGPVTIYSYLESVGIINSHSKDCFRFSELKNL